MGTKAVIILSLCIIGLVSSATLTWIADSISFVTQGSTTSSSQWNYDVTADSNGPLYPDVGGHFTLSLTMTYSNGLQYIAQTECINLVTDKPSDIQQKITNSAFNVLSAGQSIDIGGKLGNVVIPKSKKFLNNYNSTSRSKTTLHFEFVSKVPSISTISVTADRTKCKSIRTFGKWSDKTRWREGKVPSSIDNVIISAGSGVILFKNDVTVSSLTTEGGELQLLKSGCPQDWSIEDTSDTLADRCFKLVEEPLSFYDATKYCNQVQGAGTARRNLVHITDRAQLSLMYRMCRPIQNLGCWIGLSDKEGKGQFEWIVANRQNLSSTESQFLDWRRFEPNNHTVSLGVESVGGERCAHLIPWQQDPLLEEEGGWNDDACTLKRPFICQLSANSIRYKLTVLVNTVLNDGSVVGGVFSMGTGTSTITRFSLLRSAKLLVNQGSANTIINTLILKDGSKLLVNGGVQLTKSTFIGELSQNTDNGAQSYVTLSTSSALAFSSSNSIATVNARVEGSGPIVVAQNTTLKLTQGGKLSEASVNLQSADSKLLLAGYSTRLMTYDSYELVLSHRGRLNGEFYGSKQYSTEKRNKHDAYVKGVYRLKVGNTLNSATEMTDCIPYNATVDEMTQSINKLLQISKRRGVTVRRYGDQYDPRYSFGYTYRIEVDAASTSYADQGALTLTLGCYGLSCGCADTKVIKYGPTGAPLCPNPSNYSLVTDNSCIIPPTISTARITKLSYLKTSGSGILQISDGAHRLPPLATVKISITSGKGVVTADTVAWTALEAKGVGKIIIGGAGWPGWDSSHLLFDPEWTDRRGLVKSLRNAPPCNLTSNQFLVDGFGSVLTAGPGSYLIWNTGTWSGGIIGGLSKLSIEQRIDMKGSQKALKYGMSMFVRPAATADWSQGNISLSNGAHVIIEGKLIVSNIAGKYPVAVGESHLLESSDSNGRALELLQAEQGRNWQSYFDNKIVTELRSGWYENPLCEGKCLLINELVIQGNGEIRAGDGSATIYLLPLNIVGSTRFNIRAGAIVNLASGGIFGNDVIVDLSVGTTLELSGGQMLMEATCTIQGAGELLVSAGSHNLAFSVDSHITIAGGTLVWPESRGTQKTITFNGGLLIKGTGQLEVQPFSTTIVVHEEVYLKDRSIIQFPLIGIAAQASPFDRSDAPDTSPRGTLTSTGTMRWEGGSLKGKADFNAEKELFLDGDSKYIKSLAKLVNKGHCEWGSGNIVTSDNGDFQNFGTIQMKEGVSKFSSNALYKGSELPVDNGGDFFALEYHSWDTDNGALDYREYLQLRTRFVSRVPDGWTSQDQ